MPYKIVILQPTGVTGLKTGYNRYKSELALSDLPNGSYFITWDPQKAKMELFDLGRQLLVIDAFPGYEHGTAVSFVLTAKDRNRKLVALNFSTHALPGYPFDGMIDKHPDGGTDRLLTYLRGFLARLKEDPTW